MPVHSPRGRRRATPLRLGRASSGPERRRTRALAATTAGAVAAVLLYGWPAAGQQGGDDPRDRLYATTIVNQALETERTNVEVPWSNPETGHRGIVVVLRTYYRDGGATPCRDYVRTLERPGSPSVVTEGTGCRVGPARWQLEERTARATAAREPRPLGRTGAAAEPPAPESPPRDTRRAEREEAEPEVPARREPAEAPAAETAARPSAAEAAPPPPAFPSYTMPSKTAL